ncbi:Glycerophosphocholine phosphodiesterase [Neonectria punicea]|uniref:Glycerophosphocholine phosphodiesterase n=1 Tax=Neonectria punicea TaxID=979145 RepID=A0ABR1GW85_9HYPO
MQLVWASTECLVEHSDLLATAISSEFLDIAIRLTQEELKHFFRLALTPASLITKDGSPMITLRTGATKQHFEASILPRRSPINSVIFVYLGTLDLFEETSEIDLAPYRRRISPAQMPDTCLDLSIYLVGAAANKSTSDPDSAAIAFKITSLLEKKPIGTGVALLGSLKEGLGANRESRVRDFTIPLVSDQYGHVGTVVFTFLVARPYHGPDFPPSIPQTLDRKSTSTLGGHCGNGQNDNSACLQVGENKLQSFRTAIDHGADGLEFGETKVAKLRPFL